MMMHSAPALTQRRLCESSRVCAAPRPSLSLRPVVLRRFREDDKVADQLQRRQRAEDVMREQEKRLVDELKASSDSFKGSKAQQPWHVAREGVKVDPLTPAFTRRRELFVGRLAMAGYFMACFWEWFFPSHPNVLQQVSGILPVPPFLSLVLITGVVAYNVLGGLSPWGPTFSRDNLRDITNRPSGPFSSSLDDKKFFGITGWGFTRANELFHGRVAMIGFLAALLQQLRLGGLSGPGPLAQIATYLHVPADDYWYGAVGAYFVGFAVFAVAVAYMRGKTGFGERNDY